MKPFKIIVTLLLAFVQILVFAQKKPVKLENSEILPPPKVIDYDADIQNKKVSNPVYQLLAKHDGKVAFSWKLDQDTLLAKNSLIEEIIQITCYNGNCDDAEVISDFTIEDYQMRKNPGPTSEYIFPGPTTTSMQMTTFDFSLLKNIITLTDSKSKKTKKLKVNLNKSGKEIISIQDLATKKTYIPSKPFSGANMISM